MIFAKHNKQKTKNMCPSKMEMSPSLIKSVKASRQRYAFYLEEQKKVQVKNSLDKQRAILQEEILEVSFKKDNFVKCCQSLDNDFVDLVRKEKR